MCHKIDLFLKQRCLSKQFYWNHKFDQISRLFNQFNMIIVKKHINERNNHASRKILEEIIHWRKQIDVLNDDSIYLHCRINESIFLEIFLLHQKTRIAIWFMTNFRISLSIQSCRILIIISLNVFEMRNVDDCHVLCDIVLIFCDDVISDLTRFIFENFQIIVVLLLNNIYVKTFFF